jgi:hypothetical protein
MPIRHGDDDAADDAADDPADDGGAADDGAGGGGSAAATPAASSEIRTARAETRGGRRGSIAPWFDLPRDPVSPGVAIGRHAALRDRPTTPAPRATGRPGSILFCCRFREGFA